MNDKAFLEEQLTYICETIGPRMVASPQNATLEKYITSAFEKDGLSVEFQPFDCVTWSPVATILSLNGEVLPALQNPFSRSIEIEAGMMAVKTLDELRTANINDKVCVLMGDLSKGPYSTLSNPVYLPPEHKEILELLMEKRPLAVVCISLSFDYLVPIIEDWDFVIPSITVPPNVGLKLVDHLDQKLKISIRSEISPGQANNIVGRLGSPDDSRIVLMAHFDTKPYTPGAFDNGAGIAILLALAKSLSQRRDLKIGLEFVAFNGEEYGLGGYPYLEQFGLAPVPFGTETPWKRSALDLVQLAINVDGVGTKLDATTISIAEVSSALEDRINAMLSEKNNFLIVPMWPASNHYDFYTHHVPTVAFNSVGTSNFIHTEHDSLRWLNVDILAEIIVLINELVDLVNTRPKNWGRQ